jgi:hypothetical protein
VKFCFDVQGLNEDDQTAVDTFLLDLDGTENKSMQTNSNIFKGKSNNCILGYYNGVSFHDFIVRHFTIL